jgi:hypothetical protein
MTAKSCSLLVAWEEDILDVLVVGGFGRKAWIEGSG